MELLHCLFSLSSLFSAVVVVVVFNPLSALSWPFISQSVLPPTPPPRHLATSTVLVLDIHSRRLTIFFHQRANTVAKQRHMYNYGLLSCLL